MNRNQAIAHFVQGGVNFPGVGRLGRVALVVVGSLVPFVVLPACDQTNVIVDCVSGYHYPPGREDTCVPDTIPSSTETRLLAEGETVAHEYGGSAHRVVALPSTLGEASAFTVIPWTYSDLVLLSKAARVWVAEVSGHFIATTPRTTGNTLVILMDANQLIVHDVAITHKWIDLSHLGFVHVLKAR